MSYYRNIKNGKLYVKLGEAIDTTNERDGVNVIIYYCTDNHHKLYVRGTDEFYSKFEDVKNKEI